MSEAAPSPGAREGIPFVVSGPSGTGKTSILRRVVERDPRVSFSVSHTTRPSRPGERDRNDYCFVSKGEFRELIEKQHCLEWAEYQGNLYGTSRDAVAEPVRAGIDVLLEVEVQGARQLRDQLSEGVFVFVLPPSMEVLERRLRGRGSDEDLAIRSRLSQAHGELREVHIYDYVLINDELERTVVLLEHIISACRCNRDRVLPLCRDRFDFG